MLKKIFLKLIFLFCVISNVYCKDFVRGFPKIIDADTIVLNGIKIRLHGIDAPEVKQICSKPLLSFKLFSFSKEYECGKYAKNKLFQFVNKKKIKCFLDKKDFFDRYLGTCFYKKKNINSWLVKNGYALAFSKYSKKYIFDQNFAKKNRLGIWKGSFEKPWHWRKRNK